MNRSKSIAQLTTLFAQQILTPLSLIQEQLSLIQSKNSTFNAFISLPDAQHVLSLAAASTHRWQNGSQLSSIDGISFAIKDNLCLNNKCATTAGSKMLAEYVSPFSADVCIALEKCGAIIMGKTSMDEFGMGSYGLNSSNGFFKSTKHPFDEACISGGSSSGSAVAVALDMASAALGSDTGGSVRLPASYCNVIGFKPSYGAISRYGLITYAQSLDTVGIIGKSYNDISLIFDAILNAGINQDMTQISIKAKNHNLKTKIDIGIPTDIFTSDMDAKYLHDFEITLDILRRSPDVSINEISMPFLRQSLACYYIIASAEAASSLARYDGKKYGHRSFDLINTRSEGFGEEVKRRIQIGSFISSAGQYESFVEKANRVRQLIIQDFEKAFEAIDYLFCPVSASSAPMLQSLQEIDNSGIHEWITDLFTVPFSLAKMPVVTIKSPDIPHFGYQLAGRLQMDRQVLAAAERVHNILHDKCKE